jgi:hypothetical protein
MHAPQAPRIGREWLIALLSYALVVAPFGCQFQAEMLAPDNAAQAPGFDSAGMFINEDLASDLMVAGRDASGAAFFVYGTRLADGGIGEVDAVLVRGAAGAESFLTFEQGRPVHAEGPDGSYLQIEYTDVAPLRLAARVTVFDAGRGDAIVQTVEIDLTQTVEQAAATLAQVTGERVPTPTAKGVQVAADSGAKADARALGPVVTLLAALAVVAVGSVTVLTLGQVAGGLADVLGAAFTATMLIALSPVILLTKLIENLRGRAQAAPLIEIFIELPRRP